LAPDDDRKKKTIMGTYLEKKAGEIWPGDESLIARQKDGRRMAKSVEGRQVEERRKTNLSRG